MEEDVSGKNGLMEEGKAQRLLVFVSLSLSEEDQTSRVEPGRIRNSFLIT